MNSSRKEFIIKSAIASAEGHNPCIKQRVYAMIEIGDKKVFGTNKMLNDEVTECPRDMQGYVNGAGYHLCKEVCQQNAHAEVDAIKNAEILGIDINGGKLTLVGHTYCCNDCKSAMDIAGIVEVEIIE